MNKINKKYHSVVKVQISNRNVVETSAKSIESILLTNKYMTTHCPVFVRRV